jgi:hypothetical protein
MVGIGFGGSHDGINFNVLHSGLVTGRRGTGCQYFVPGVGICLMIPIPPLAVHFNILQS